MAVQTAASCGYIDPVWMNCSKDTKKEFHLHRGCLRGPCVAAAAVVGMLRQCVAGCESKQLYAICMRQ